VGSVIPRLLHLLLERRQPQSIQLPLFQQRVRLQ
jgi:hypothetical protein